MVSSLAELREATLIPMGREARGGHSEQVNAAARSWRCKSSPRVLPTRYSQQGEGESMAGTHRTEVGQVAKTSSCGASNTERSKGYFCTKPSEIWASLLAPWPSHQPCSRGCPSTCGACTVRSLVSICAQRAGSCEDQIFDKLSTSQVEGIELIFSGLVVPVPQVPRKQLTCFYLPQVEIPGVIPCG